MYDTYSGVCYMNRRFWILELVITLLIIRQKSRICMQFVRNQVTLIKDCNSGIPGFPNPGIPEIFQSRNRGIEPHSIPRLRD